MRRGSSGKSAAAKAPHPYRLVRRASDGVTPKWRRNARLK
jgi:hypothetical protein